MNSSSAKRGTFFVIGTGPASSINFATYQALETISGVDQIIAPPEQVALFSKQIEDTPVLFDPWESMFTYKGKFYSALTKDEKRLCKAQSIEMRDHYIKEVKTLLENGEDIGLLDYGNPCVFGPSHWYIEQLHDYNVKIVPGMGVDAVALAALGKSAIPAHDTKFVVQTSPMFLFRDEDEDCKVLELFNEHSTTLIFYMALWDTETLFMQLSKYLDRNLPCAVVYWAGDPDREKIIRGSLGEMNEKLDSEEETFMGLLLIGKFLNTEPHKPYSDAIYAE